MGPIISSFLEHFQTKSRAIIRAKYNLGVNLRVKIQVSLMLLFYACVWLVRMQAGAGGIRTDELSGTRRTLYRHGYDGNAGKG